MEPGEREVSDDSKLDAHMNINWTTFESWLENPKIENEMPSFCLRALSPDCRSLSPIDTAYQFSELERETTNPVPAPIPRSEVEDGGDSGSDDGDAVPLMDDSFISFSEIDAHITPLKATKGLETIFEGIFLETPNKSHLRDPRKGRKRQCGTAELKNALPAEEADGGEAMTELTGISSKKRLDLSLSECNGDED